MTLAEILDNKRTIFARPSTKREIIRGRKIIHVDRFEDIVPALEQRRENEALMIGPSVDLIPINKEGAPQYYSSQNYSKRGPLVKLKTLPIRQSIEEEWTPLKARIEASQRHQSSQERYIGLYWRDPEGYAHIVQPWMILEGRRLEMFGHLSNNIQDRVEYKKFYKAKDSNSLNITMLVPSRSGKEKHQVVIEHLTRLNDPNRFVEWMRFKTRHSCHFKDQDFSFRFKQYETYCPHDVAAHVAYSRRVAEKSGKIALQPFPMFTEPMLRLYLSLIYDTMKINQDENGKIKTIPIPFTQINPILMNAWLRLDKDTNKHTFYVHAPTKGYKTMRDYNWQNSAPGMKFIE